MTTKTPGASAPLPSAAFTSPLDARRYALAGHATLTLRSRRTGAHFTYKVEAPRSGDTPDHLRFVKLLIGPDNTADFVYMGTLAGATLRHTAKSKVPKGAPSWRAFDYFTRHVLAQRDLPQALEIRHEGRCGACGRPLTVPESIDRGIGPECAKRMLIAEALAPFDLTRETDQ